MIRTLLLALLLTGSVQAGSIQGVAVLSHDLGYESTGFGIQLDTDYRSGDWGFDLQGTVLNHGKADASGHRLQAIVMGRRHLGQMFVEAGIEWGGYSSEFPDGREWVKYGFAPGVGLGAFAGETEWTFRYFLPDSTPNETSVIALAADFPVFSQWRGSVKFEVWSFDQAGDSFSGTQATIGLGYSW